MKTHFLALALLLPACGKSPLPRTCNDVKPKLIVADHTPVSPKKPLTSPFTWEISVRYPDKTLKTFSPGKDSELVPLTASSWKCGQSGLVKETNAKGSYLETRDIVCQLPSGEIVGSRTACLRHPDGKVEADSQVLVVVDHVEHLILTQCADEGATSEGEAVADDAPRGSRTPLFTDPKTTTL